MPEAFSMTSTIEDIVNAFRHFETFNVSRDRPRSGYGKRPGATVNRDERSAAGTPRQALDPGRAQTLIGRSAGARRLPPAGLLSVNQAQSAR
jgi:hypothetical protein